jgi:hypothetical protein
MRLTLLPPGSICARLILLRRRTCVGSMLRSVLLGLAYAVGFLVVECAVLMFLIVGIALPIAAASAFAYVTMSS